MLCPQDIVDVLNEALQADPEAITELHQSAALCRNGNLLAHRDIICREVSGKPGISFMGLLNGVMSRNYKRQRIAAKVCQETGIVQEFAVVFNNE